MLLFSKSEDMGVFSGENSIQVINIAIPYFFAWSLRYTLYLLINTCTRYFQYNTADPSQNGDSPCVPDHTGSSHIRVAWGGDWCTTSLAIDTTSHIMISSHSYAIEVQLCVSSINIILGH